MLEHLPSTTKHGKIFTERKVKIIAAKSLSHTPPKKDGNYDTEHKFLPRIAQPLLVPSSQISLARWQFLLSGSHWWIASLFAFSMASNGESGYFNSVLVRTIKVLKEMECSNCIWNQLKMNTGFYLYIIHQFLITIIQLQQSSGQFSNSNP